MHLGALAHRFKPRRPRCRQWLIASPPPLTPRLAPPKPASAPPALATVASSPQPRRRLPNAPLPGLRTIPASPLGLMGTRAPTVPLYKPRFRFFPALGLSCHLPFPASLFTQRRTGTSSSSLCHRYVSSAFSNLPLRACPCPHIHGPCFSPLPPSRDPSPTAAPLANRPNGRRASLRAAPSPVAEAIRCLDATRPCQPLVFPLGQHGSACIR